jgi:hypothetical protein
MDPGGEIARNEYEKQKNGKRGKRETLEKSKREWRERERRRNVSLP